MEYKGHHEQEDDVYGGDVPEEAYMESDFDQSMEAHADVDSKSEELESMKKRLQEIEEEASALRDMQAKVEKEMGATQGLVAFLNSMLIVMIVTVCNLDTLVQPINFKIKRIDFQSYDSTGGSATQAEKEEVDSRSIYVGNVDYACTPEEVQQHFQSCGTVNRVTILTDKYGQPKGFAYVEFVETEAVQNAVLLNESELHGRQLKVSAKRTNVPGMKQYRGRRPNPYLGSRRPFFPGFPAYPPYGYGRVPRFRRPMRYRPY
ncbi:polyadenylate-binding protein 1 [Dorcoceras hygrometricum]|uniref:Polyadenylate-binding protein 1 n=1 Tax=Dorcoceras hygrometricum TaxID=472368 RepID=A0A2Z7BRH0_9LAMI|nr:polyadenylate-binding protein 1 [Dorcoceras hygrometricum]